MIKVFIGNRENKSSLAIEILCKYTQLVPSTGILVPLSGAEQEKLGLEKLPCLLREGDLLYDLSDIMKYILKESSCEILNNEAIVSETIREIVAETEGKGLSTYLNAKLANSQFLHQNHITAADLFALAFSINYIIGLKDEEKRSMPHTYRYINYLQNMPGLKDILAEFNLIMLPLGPEEESKEAPQEEKKSKSQLKKEAKLKAKGKDIKDIKPKAQKAVPKKNEHPLTMVNMKVGKVMKISKHPDSTKLYVEEIDIGGEVRQIATGLQEFVPMEEIDQQLVVVFTNLKSKKLGGYPSHGMVLCASNSDRTSFELLKPPQGANIGDAVFFEGYEWKANAEINLSKKNNAWDAVQPMMKTNVDLMAVYEGKKMMVGEGCVTVKSLIDAHIS